MLEDVRKQFQKLIALYEEQRVRADMLESEIVRERSKNEAFMERIAALEEQAARSSLSQAFLASGTDRAGAREKIDRLIREIDACISLLEKK